MITNFFLALILTIFNQHDVPYKASDEFELKVNYIFKDRPPIDRQIVINDDLAKASSGPLAYLMLEIKVLAVSNQEYKIRVVDSNGYPVFNRKAAVGTIIKIDWGYTEDIKEKLSPHEFTVFFNNSDKKPVSKIYMTIQDDGIFLVNGEKHGKF